MSFTRKVLVVDDEPIIRTLIAERLATSGFECFTAADALSAKRVMLKEDPDALVVDLDLGDGPSGTELIAAISAINPSLGFVLLTNYSPTAVEMKAAPNLRYLNKRAVSDIAMVIDALDSVLRYGESRFEAPPSGKLSKLTKGQAEVLNLLAKGLTNAEIAEVRKVGLRAIEQTVHRIYHALGISQGSGSSRVTAARIFASEMGLRRGDR